MSYLIRSEKWRWVRQRQSEKYCRTEERGRGDQQLCLISTSLEDYATFRELTGGKPNETRGEGLTLWIAHILYMHAFTLFRNDGSLWQWYEGWGSQSGICISFFLFLSSIDQCLSLLDKWEQSRICSLWGWGRNALTRFIVKCWLGSWI